MWLTLVQHCWVFYDDDGELWLCCMGYKSTETIKSNRHCSFIAGCHEIIIKWWKIMNFSVGLGLIYFNISSFAVKNLRRPFQWEHNKRSNTHTQKQGENLTFSPWLTRKFIVIQLCYHKINDRYYKIYRPPVIPISQTPTILVVKNIFHAYLGCVSLYIKHVIKQIDVIWVEGSI